MLNDWLISKLLECELDQPPLESGERIEEIRSDGKRLRTVRTNKRTLKIEVDLFANTTPELIDVKSNSCFRRSGGAARPEEEATMKNTITAKMAVEQLQAFADGMHDQGMISDAMYNACCVVIQAAHVSYEGGGQEVGA